jgi:glutamine amidotransferase
MQKIVLIDYGSGNLRSAQKALVAAAATLSGTFDICASDDPKIIAAADRLVLPGVGAFAACMRALGERTGVIEAMTEAVQQGAKPFLGVCVGMQLLAERGLEFGQTQGLGWVGGEVRPLTPNDPHCKIPHMGWNALEEMTDHPLLRGLEVGAHMYFTHSYALFPSDPSNVIAQVDHGGRFTATVAKANVAGVQFHPEKSQSAGLRLLANFLEWRP